MIEEKYHWQKHIEVDTSDPVHALVEKWYWGFEGDMVRQGRIELSQEYSKAFHVDGIVIQETKSCRQNSQGSLMAQEILRKTIDMPIMTFQSDMTDPREYSFQEFQGKFEPFMEIVESSKAIGRRKF